MCLTALGARVLVGNSLAENASTTKHFGVAFATMADDNSISFWWILLFVILALGVAAGAVLFVGGDLFASPGFVVSV